MLLLQGKPLLGSLLASAEALARELVACRRAALGDRHPDTVQSTVTFAMVLGDLGKLPAAELLMMRKALAVRRQMNGERDPLTLSTVSLLGSLLLNAGKLRQAELLYREALAGRRAALGHASPPRHAGRGKRPGARAARARPVAGSGCAGGRM
jgi:hypothetical protein